MKVMIIQVCGFVGRKIRELKREWAIRNKFRSELSGELVSRHGPLICGHDVRSEYYSIAVYHIGKRVFDMKISDVVDEIDRLILSGKVGFRA